MFQEMKVKPEDAEMKDVTNTGEKKEVPTWLSKVSSEYFDDILEYTWIYLDILGYTWIYLDILRYTWIYLDILGYT